MDDGSIIAIDEVEHGLEPHRLAQVLHHLKKRTKGGDLQVIMTTHSPVTVKALSAVDIVVVRSDEAGETTCRPVPGDLDNVQGTFRSAPDALLGRRVLVGEGATEVGFLRGLLRHWDTQRIAAEQPGAAALGVVLVNGGGGAQSTERAQHFQELGYPTCLLVDNDDPAINKSAEQAMDSGVIVHRWGADNAIEDEIIQTLDAHGLQALVDLAVKIRDEHSIRANVGASLGNDQLTGTDFASWQAQAGVNETEIRGAIAAAATAKKKEWFKREDRGEELAEVVIRHWADLGGTHLMKVIDDLRDFAYAAESEPPAESSERPFDG